MMKTQTTQHFIVLQQGILLYGWKFFPSWLLRRHMTFNNETVSRQNLRAGNIAKSMTSKGNSGCLFTIYKNFREIRLESKWNTTF